ncbi:MAG: hypothetical protein ABEJ65_10215, partial [bacterium]
KTKNTPARKTQPPAINYFDIDISGQYTVSGVNPGGGKYKGTAKIEKTGSTYQIKWSINQGATFVGTGIVIDDVFAVGYQGKGVPGVIAYEIEEGRLIGKWAIDKKGSVQSEVLTLME